MIMYWLPHMYVTMYTFRIHVLVAILCICIINILSICQFDWVDEW